MVIGYSYLWVNELNSGAIEGRKNRPCVIILSIKDDQGETVITAAPITHTEPNIGAGIEIPAPTRQRLGLDGGRSWIITSEVNQFIWPGPDLRSVSYNEPGRFAYGFIPPKLYDEVKKQILAANNFHPVVRTE